MKNTKHIFVTNDDCVFMSGLLILTQEMHNLANVSTLAPDRHWSGGGHVKTFDRPLRVKEVVLADGSPAHASYGALSNYLALALLGFFDEKIDLVVSGTNPMVNLAHDVTYSGTVTPAMEAINWDAPGIAFSRGTKENQSEPLDYSAAVEQAVQCQRSFLGGWAWKILPNI